MISNNQYQGVTSFSNAFFYILSLNFQKPGTCYPLNLSRRTTAQKDIAAIRARGSNGGVS